MNDNQLISMLMNGTDLQEVAKIDVEPIVAQSEALLRKDVQKVVESPAESPAESPIESKTLGTKDLIKLSDYVYSMPAGDLGMLENCGVPNYRLAQCCANCAFSVYDPVLNSARCVKWDCCIVPVYYCDEHKDPRSLISKEDNVEETEKREEEEYKEEIGLELLSEQQPRAATFYQDSTPLEDSTTPLEDSISPLDSSHNTTSITSPDTPLQLISNHYKDQELFLAATTNVPAIEPEVYKQAYIKKKYLQLYKEKYGSFEGAVI
jgi:hypothetical protein